MLTLSKSSGTGGRIKEFPEDFIVKEITSGGVTLEPGVRYDAQGVGDIENPQGKFSTFVLQKKDWNTIQALITIAKKLGRGKKSVSYAGTKDRKAISVQLASIFGVLPEAVEKVRVKDISINGAWRSDGVEMGDNIGNAFEIIIRDVANVDAASQTIEELGGRMPNYFDRQRFGDRLGNAAIGLDLMNGRFEQAAMRILTDTTGETNVAASEARRKLAEDMDFTKALEYFPRYLKSERGMLQNLAQYGNYAGAIRTLHRGISIMFIHAVESLVFNMALEQRVRESDFESGIFCQTSAYGFPNPEKITSERSEFPAGALVGYQTEDSAMDERTKKAMERLGITKESFRIKSMPELSMKGSCRPLLAPVKRLIMENQGDSSVKVSFSIPSGSYATVMINEITKSDNLDLESLIPK